jgi:uncharacterized iron-regulated membrane protein
MSSIWPKIPAPFVRAVLAGHSALGLAFAALIYLVCFSGTVAVLANEWSRWEQPQIAPTTTAPTPAAIDTAFAEALAVRPGTPAIYLSPPTDVLPRFDVTIAIPGSTEFDDRIADADGHLGVTAKANAFTAFLTDLHIDLHLPRVWGEFIVGLTGVALLSSLVSGLFAHPRIFRDAFHLRWGGSKRLHEADLHNRVGIWGLPFHIVVSLSGALLGLTTLLVGILSLVLFKGDMNKTYDLFLPPHLPVNAATAPLPSTAPMFARLEEIAPGQTLKQIYINNPGRADQVVNISVGGKDTISPGERYAFDSKGKELPGSGPKHSLGASINNALGYIHFGWFGSLPIKLAYVLLGAGLCVVTASGVGIWLARRRDKGRPAPTWEKVWTAFCWGQPAAYAVTAAASILLGTVPLVAIWLVATLAALALTFAFDRPALSVTLRAVSAALIAAVAGLHVVTHASAMADVMGWAIDAGLIVIALLLAWPLVLSRKRAQTTVTQTA